MDGVPQGRTYDAFTHARHRPDMYIGRVSVTTEDAWVWDDAAHRVVKRSGAQWVPGLLKVVEEVVSNAVDNVWRSREAGVPVKRIDISVAEDGEVAVTNDGLHIPVVPQTYEMKDPYTHAVTRRELYPGELYFRYLLSGTNYDDTELRKTSGRNGMGAKAANVFSTAFAVDHVDPHAGKRFRQSYTNTWTAGTEAGAGAVHMRVVPTAPRVTASSRKTGYTTVTFTPDYAYFGTPVGGALFHTFRAMVHKLALDAAMVTGVTVRFNGADVKARTLKAYAKLFFPDAPHMLEVQGATPSETCECLWVVTGDGTGGTGTPTGAVSFVNGVETRRGGVHVRECARGLFDKLTRAFNAKYGEGGRTPVRVSRRDWAALGVLFVRCDLNAPQFTSQTKEECTAPPPPPLAVPAAAVAKVLAWDVVKAMVARLRQAHHTVPAAAPTGRKPCVLLGEAGKDANWAGGAKSGECALLITEGLSAKSFAISGIASVAHGHNRYGVMAIKGKFINAETNSTARVKDNKEVDMLVKVLNLGFGVDYTSASHRATLRYGSVVLLTDADDDGIHIRGLLLAFFRRFFPGLLTSGFLRSMSTPVLRVWPGGRRGAPPLDYYTVPAFRAAMRRRAREHPATPLPSPKYYKGLGTYSHKDAAQFFAAPKVVQYVYDPGAPQRMTMAFCDDKASAARRKAWIRDAAAAAATEGGGEDAEGGTPRDTYEGPLPISGFVDHQLILYNLTTLSRAIPCVFDGFKECQRKIFYGLRKKAPTTPVIVERLMGAVADVAQYHHGGESLQKAMVGMAQSFVGSNNVPLLVGESQFGTRLQGGKDASQARYIETMMDPIARALFPPEDDALLEAVLSDGVPCEPTTYVPVLPMVLVNGADGTATGFKTHVPCYNPRDLVQWVRARLGGRPPPPLLPWYRGFRGEVAVHAGGPGGAPKWSSKGHVARIDVPGAAQKGRGVWYAITELPIGTWTESYKTNVLEALMGEGRRDGASGGAKKKAPPVVVHDVKEFNGPNSVTFHVRVSGEGTHGDGPPSPLLLKALRLEAVQTFHMVFLDDRRALHVCSTAEEVAEAWLTRRAALYQRRLAHLKRAAQERLARDRDTLTFLQAVVDGRLRLHAVTSAEVEAKLRALGVTPRGEGEGHRPSFQYVLHIPVASLTTDNVARMQRRVDAQEERYRAELARATATDLFLADLARFEEAYAAFEARLAVQWGDAPTAARPRAPRRKRT